MKRILISGLASLCGKFVPQNPKWAFAKPVQQGNWKGRFILPIWQHGQKRGEGLDDYIYNKVSDVIESWVRFANKTLTPHRMHKNSLSWPLMHKLSKYVWHAMGESRPFGRKNLFSKKKHLKTAFFSGQKSASPHFGRTGEQTSDSRSTSGIPLKALGYNGSN